jgi:hypothetical protein
MLGNYGSRTPARLRLAALLLAAPLAVVTTGTVVQAAPVPAVAVAQTVAAPADTGAVAAVTGAAIGAAIGAVTAVVTAVAIGVVTAAVTAIGAACWRPCSWAADPRGGRGGRSRPAPAFLR